MSKNTNTTLECPTCHGTCKIMHYGGVELTCHTCQGLGGIALPSCEPVKLENENVTKAKSK